MKAVTISSWLNFSHPAPPGRGSVAGRNFFGSALLQPARSVCNFASLWALSSFTLWLFASVFRPFSLHLPFWIHNQTHTKFVNHCFSAFKDLRLEIYGRTEPLAILAPQCVGGRRYLVASCIIYGMCVCVCVCVIRMATVTFLLDYWQQCCNVMKYFWGHFWIHFRDVIYIYIMG